MLGDARLLRPISSRLVLFGAISQLLISITPPSAGALMVPAVKSPASNKDGLTATSMESKYPPVMQARLYDETAASRCQSHANDAPPRGTVGAWVGGETERNGLSGAGGARLPVQPVALSATQSPRRASSSMQTAAPE